MIDEVAEVRKYMNGARVTDSSRLYHITYMIAKYMRSFGVTPVNAVKAIQEWLAGQDITHTFSVQQCVKNAYANPGDLKSGATVRISKEDINNIKTYAPTAADRKVALALLCNAKAYADWQGVFRASSDAVGYWLNMNAANIRSRHFKRLVEWGYIERVNPDENDMRKRFGRSTSCFKILVPYKNSGEYELVDNDIERLYHQAFDEAK